LPCPVQKIGKGRFSGCKGTELNPSERQEKVNLVKTLILQRPQSVPHFLLSTHDLRLYRMFTENPFMNRSLLVITVLLAFLTSGCKKKTYYVHILKTNNTEHIDTIHASSDSAAYARGYKYYVVSLLVENMVMEEVEKSGVPMDQRFYVKNRSGKTIKYNLSDQAKKLQEQKAKDAVGGVGSGDEEE
jgi:hypothetical protein